MKYGRGYNFGAGPSTLPLEVLEEVQAQLLNWQDTGMSILELGHRTPQFMNLLSKAEQKLRALLDIPSHYHVLFVGGATRSQFSTLPFNTLGLGSGAYLVTGMWSKMAYEEATRVADAYCIASSESSQFTAIPDLDALQFKKNTQYLYYTPNETVNGVYCPYPQAAKKAGIPIVADMTSCILTEPITVSDYAMIIAGAQKNLANAGLTVLIINDDFLNLKPLMTLPLMMDYRHLAQHHSLYATPPTFNCYLADKMLDWLISKGGLSKMKDKHHTLSHALYEYIDSSSTYVAKVQQEARSKINICFDLKDTKYLDLFIQKAAEEDLLALKGHRAVGGLRASIYNAMPDKGVYRLKTFMQAFKLEHKL